MRISVETLGSSQKRSMQHASHGGSHMPDEQRQSRQNQHGHWQEHV